MQPSGPRKRDCVLVVDDDEEIREIYRLTLGDHGYRVEIAENGEAALQQLQAEPDRHALVLLDLMMPRLGGPGFLKRKAADPQLADLPVVVVSAVTDLMPLPDTPDVRAVLRKPVSITELLSVVRRCTNEGAGPTPPDESPVR